jgi:hypothetical protein
LRGRRRGDGHHRVAASFQGAGVQWRSGEPPRAAGEEIGVLCDRQIEVDAWQEELDGT